MLVARAAEPVPRLARASTRRFLPLHRRTLTRLAPRPGRARARRRTHAGTAQRGLFRARLSRQLSRLYPGAGRRPLGARRRTVAADAWAGSNASTPSCGASTTAGATRSELREDSFLGVPGLVQAMRAGQSGDRQRTGQRCPRASRAAGLPAGLCRAPAGRGTACSRTSRPGGAAIPSRACRCWIDSTTIVIKPLTKRLGQRCLFLRHHGAAARKALVQAIQTVPASYIAQERIQPSTAPALIGRHLEPRPSVLRTFLIAEEDGYAVMPGGLGRVTPEPDAALQVSNQLGGLGKDVWVLASEPERQESLLVDRPRCTPRP